VFLFITLACCKTSVAFSSCAKGRTCRVADYSTSLFRLETQLHVAVGRLGKNRWGTLVDGRNQDDVRQEKILEVPNNLVTTATNNVKPSLTRRDTTVVSYKNGQDDDHSSMACQQPPRLMENDVMVRLPSSSCATQGSIPQLRVAVVVVAPPREIDLPITHEQQVRLIGVDTIMFDSIETLMGRLAMVAAILFFVVEVSTGMSIPEQVSWLAS
jgi:hypothetical protein